MPTKEELEQKRLRFLKRADAVKAEIKRKEKIEKEKARKQDTHNKIIMGGALKKALNGIYLNESECELMVDWLTKKYTSNNGTEYTLADKLIEYIQSTKKA